MYYYNKDNTVQSKKEKNNGHKGCVLHGNIRKYNKANTILNKKEIK